MKRLLSLLLLLFTLNAFGQSVAGVSLRDEYSKVERTLEQRYGSTLAKTHSEIGYKNISIGKIEFDWAIFQFAYISESQKMLLDKVQLFSTFKLYEFKEAKEFIDYIVSVYSQKYDDIVKVTDKEGLPLYGCSWNNFYSRHNIIISLNKRKNEDGTYYTVNVLYGPAYEDLIDDI